MHVFTCTLVIYHFHYLDCAFVSFSLKCTIFRSSTFKIPANTSTLIQRWNSVDHQCSSTLTFGWKWKLSRRTFIDVVSTLTKQCWNNVDRVTLIQCWWLSVVSTLVLGWKGKLSQGMLIGVEKTALKQLCQYFLYWGSLESGSIIKQN